MCWPVNKAASMQFFQYQGSIAAGDNIPGIPAPNHNENDINLKDINARNMNTSPFSFSGKISLFLSQATITATIASQIHITFTKMDKHHSACTVGR